MADTVTTYRYDRASSLTGDGLGLATSGGVDRTTLLRAFVDNTPQFARALLAIAEVARTRHFDLDAMRYRDPVITSNLSVVRFESFSSCNGVYARFDLDIEGLDVEHVTWGTTNIDINDPLRLVLAGMTHGEPLRLTVGSEATTVESMNGAAIEKKVPLPTRWLRAMAEVQIISSTMDTFATFAGSQASAVAATIAAVDDGQAAVSLRPSPSGLRVGDPSVGQPVVSGLSRLRSLERLFVDMKTLTISTAPTIGGSTREPTALAAVAQLDRARLTIVISPSVRRGFSGEGAVLDALAAADPDSVGAVESQLAGQAALQPEDFVDGVRVGIDDVSRAFAALGATGRVGHDLHTSRFFHRDLPYVRATIERLHPRLRDAERLVDTGAVDLVDDLTAYVRSQDATYLVSGVVDVPGPVELQEPVTHYACTCAWYAKHQRFRGPCKHLLAVDIVRRRRRSVDTGSRLLYL